MKPKYILVVDKGKPDSIEIETAEQLRETIFRQQRKAAREIERGLIPYFELEIYEQLPGGTERALSEEEYNAIID